MTTTPLSVGDQPGSEVDAGVDQDGAVTLAWEQEVGGSVSVVSSRRPAGGTFQAPLVLTDLADGRAEDPVLGVAPSGDVTVAYSYRPEDGLASLHVRSQVLDVNAPALTATVPTTGTAGQRALDDRRPE